MITGNLFYFCLRCVACSSFLLQVIEEIVYTLQPPTTNQTLAHPLFRALQMLHMPLQPLEMIDRLFDQNLQLWYECTAHMQDPSCEFDAWP